MKQSEKVRVLVVDDSMLARNVISKGLATHPRIEVVGTAINAPDAKRKIAQLKPDVVTMDVEMPGQTGIDFLKSYLPTNPIPVILVSARNLKVFDALEAGAVDFVRKPGEGESMNVFITALAQKVIVASKSHVRAPRSMVYEVGTKKTGTIITKPKFHTPPVAPLGNSLVSQDTIVALGASTGGTEATMAVMQRLPADMPPMVIVQHMPEGFTELYADRLNNHCHMEVREAKNGDQLRRGLALVAPAGLQTRVVRAGTHYSLTCTPGEKISGHCPSVDALFQSVSQSAWGVSVGILLTGMGQDGAAGLLAMRKRGAYTIGQDEASSVVYGMPRVAQEIGAVCTQASCDDIADILISHLRRH
jgi:two-component system chemotaxis response regulator CheB